MKMSRLCHTGCANSQASFQASAGLPLSTLQREGEEGHVFISYLPVGTERSHVSRDQFLQLEDNFDIYLAQPLNFKGKKTDAQINDLPKVLQPFKG